MLSSIKEQDVTNKQADGQQTTWCEGILTALQINLYRTACEFTEHQQLNLSPNTNQLTSITLYLRSATITQQALFSIQLQLQAELLHHVNINNVCQAFYSIPSP